MSNFLAWDLTYLSLKTSMLLFFFPFFFCLFSVSWCLYCLYCFWELFVFHMILSDSKSPQVFRTLLSILADLNNAVIWMVSPCPLISKSSFPSTNPMVTVPNAPITIGITVIFMLHSFFSSSLARLLLFGGARGVMVIVVESRNPGHDWLHFT